MPQAVYLNRISSFLPNEAISNDEMEQVLGSVDERTSTVRRLVLRNNGIKKRHYVIDKATGEIRYSNAKLAALAVQRLVGDGFSLDQIDVLAAGTSIADQTMPGHGSMVHGEVGNPPCEVVSTSGICLAGTTALKYAWMAVRSDARSAVSTASEAASVVLRAQNYEAETAERQAALESAPELAFEKAFLRWMLSDAGAAALLQNEPNATGRSLRIDWIDIFSFANELPVCMYAGAEKDGDGRLVGWASHSQSDIAAKSVMAVKQDTKLLNGLIIPTCWDRPIRRLMETRQIRATDYAWFLPHMSSEFFRKEIVAGMERTDFLIPQDRWFTNLHERGNTGSASIYLMLEDLMAQKDLRPGEKILCVIPESGRFSVGYMQLTVV